MKRILTGHDEVFGPWMFSRMSGEWVKGRGHTIGLWDDETGPIASALFENYNGASIMLHFAAIAGKRWMNRDYLWYVFHYPFEELKVKKLIAPVESTNTDSVRFTDHIGWNLEATLKDAAPKGDIKLYTMTRDQCRWLHLKDRLNGKRFSARSA